MADASRVDVRIGELAAWLYRPEATAGAVPIVVMAHGLGAVKEMRLDAFAERFTAAGFAVLAFDYRHFGGSGGRPRQLLSIRRQLADWAAAVEYARALDGVDPAKVALFGTSFSGGHVLRVAADDGDIAAVVSQCPFTDGFASARTIGLRALVGVGARASADVAAMVLRRPPVTVPLVAAPGRTALMNAPDAAPGYTALIDGFEHPNAVAARIGLTLPLYRPGRDLRRITCPVFLAVCDNDTVAPAGPTLRHAARAGANVEVRRYAEGHFDIYVPPAFDKIVTDETAFLRAHL